jgi:4-hydroxybenzoate polyprenyltransferase
MSVKLVKYLLPILVSQLSKHMFPDWPLTKRLQEWLELIKLEHTVFALPFALSGLILAGKTLPSADKWLWTIIAFTGARAAAMSLNRIIDARIDGKNPRTRQRAIPQGRINKSHALVFAVVAFVIMLAAASQLPPLCLILSPVAVFWLSFYSYTKRFSAFCHFALGIALGGAALGGWIAAGGGLLAPSAWLLAFAVTCWVTGFDIIYACQDLDFDRRENIHSLPAKLGLARSLNISRLLHILTVVGLILLGLSSHLGLIYWLGLIMVACLLIYEHSLISLKDLSRLNAAFFNINGIISILAFVSIFADRFLNNSQ